MKGGPKPVRRCYTCLLNLGDHCWKYECPRRQWDGRTCPGFENDELYRQFREWLDGPHIRTRRQLRRKDIREDIAPRRRRHIHRRSRKQRMRR
ncbi:MAG: hypothetical protein HY343_10580 [Lentisphaerae bacterium]|nr:hypothetical protein [Lentisphaerota bacterium]